MAEYGAREDKWPAIRGAGINAESGFKQEGA